MSEDDAALIAFLRIAAWFTFGVLVLMTICDGDPDIVDGLAKRANAIECVESK